MDNILKFSCDFGGGIIANIEIDVAAYRASQGKNFSQKMEWPGNPLTLEIEPLYIEWMHTVNAEVSKAVGAKYMYVFNPGHREQQIWIYHPDGPRERGGKAT